MRDGSRAGVARSRAQTASRRAAGMPAAAAIARSSVLARRRPRLKRRWRMSRAYGARSRVRRPGGGRRADAPETAVRPSSLVLRFEAIDAETGTAQLRNGAMTTDVTVRLAEGYLHLMQAFRTGPLYTTTVFEAGASAGASGRRILATSSSRRLCPARPPALSRYYGTLLKRASEVSAVHWGGFIVSGTRGAFGSSNCWIRPVARVMLRRFCGVSGARRRYSRNWVAESSYLPSSLNSSPRL